jgi:predicted Zn-dependent protease with MMP-like domain
VLSPVHGGEASWRLYAGGVFDVGPEAFEELVAEALDDLPPELARLMSNVALFVEDDNPDEHDLLGLYEGIPLTERGSTYMMAMPDRITIYRLPTLRICADADEVREQVQITVVHEIAHHFGIDDDRLHDLGYA